MTIRASDRLVCEVVAATAREKYRRVLRDRTVLENQVARLERQLDVQTHHSMDPIDVRGDQRTLLPGACQRLAAAIERCIALRPAPQPRPRQKPETDRLAEPAGTSARAHLARMAGALPPTGRLSQPDDLAMTEAEKQRHADLTANLNRVCRAWSTWFAI